MENKVESKRIKENQRVDRPCKETQKPKATKKYTEEVRSQKFNGSIAKDLIEWYDKRRQNEVIVCHIIDNFSRLSSAKIVQAVQITQTS